MEREEKLRWYRTRRTSCAATTRGTPLRSSRPSRLRGVVRARPRRRHRGRRVDRPRRPHGRRRHRHRRLEDQPQGQARAACRRQPAARDLRAAAREELWGADPEWVALDFVVPGVRVTVGRHEIDTDGRCARSERSRRSSAPRRSRPRRPAVRLVRLPGGVPRVRGRGPRRRRAPPSSSSRPCVDVRPVTRHGWRSSSASSVSGSATTPCSSWASAGGEQDPRTLGGAQSRSAAMSSSLLIEDRPGMSRSAASARSSSTVRFS
jgi:hypothetical protein